MNIGITGLAASGRSTLLAAFLGTGASPTRTTMGIVSIPDRRLDALGGIYHPKKTTYSTVNFEECIALDSQSKQDKARLCERLKVMDAFVFLIGAYRCEDSADVIREAMKLRFEMIINDLDFVTKRIERLERDMQLSPKNRLAKEKEMELLQRMRPVLEDERFLRGIAFEEQELLILGSWSLLTLKPGCFVLNVSEKQSAEEVKTFEEDLVNALCGKGDESPVLSINGALESEIAALPPDEARAFMEEYGIAEPGRERIVGAAYALLDLITFFTVSDDECRAWTLRRGGTALEAAGTVHSDLARGFIRAEVIEHDRLVSLGSLAEAKKAGKLRLEGKIYSVKDGEVVHIMFNI